MAKFDYNQYQEQEKNKDTSGNGPRVSYFVLKNDGDEAVVRFMYDSPNDFDLETVHNVQIDGRYRKVSCLKDSPFSPLEQCPLCANKDKVYQKFYVKLIEYTRNDQNQIVPVARIWERAASFSAQLKAYFDDGYNLSDCIFKIKRRGKAGDLNTTYDIIYANPQIYKPEIYVKDTSLFEGYSLYNYVVLNKTYDELAGYIKGIPLTGNTNNNSNNNNSAPAAPQQPVAPGPQSYAPSYNTPQPAAPSYPQYTPVSGQQTVPSYSYQQPTAPSYTTAPQVTVSSQNNSAPNQAEAGDVRPGRRYTY